jgi:hypothetical protein
VEAAVRSAPYFRWPGPAQGLGSEAFLRLFDADGGGYVTEDDIVRGYRRLFTTT